MSSKAFRTTAATLLLATLVSLTGAAPARAFGPGRSFGRHFEGPALTEPRSAFVAFLIRIFDFAGGAMDPNGHS